MKKSLRNGMWTIALLGGWFGVGTAFASGDLLGAREVLQRIGRAAALPVEAKPGPGADEAGKLARELREFKAARGKLPADEAVGRWLALYDRFWMLPPPELMKAAQHGPMPAREDALSVSSLLSAIPPPPAWAALKNAVLARPATGRGLSESLLRLIAAYLTRDQAGLTAGFAELKASAALRKGNSGFLEYFLQRSPALAASTIAETRKEEIADRFERYLGSLESERTSGPVTVQVPSLVDLAGEARAEALIRRALTIPGVALAVPAGGATLDLAKRYIREHAADLLEPQWQLVTGIDDIELYEALERRFPLQKPDAAEAPEPFVEGSGRDRYRFGLQDDNRRRAAANHVLGLVARKRVADAAVSAAALALEDFESSEFTAAWQSFDKMRYASETLEFCRIVLTARPELPLWSRCGLIAAAAGEQVDLAGLLAAAAARPGLDVPSRLGINERQVELLLAMDRVDDAVRLLGEALRFDAGREPPQVRLVVARAKTRVAPRLFRLGRLLGRPELSREAAGSIPSILAELRQQMGGSPFRGGGLDSSIGEMIDVLEEGGMYAEAEAVVLDAIESALGSLEAAEIPGGGGTLLAGGMLSEHLVRLVQLYDKADRPADVLALIEESPCWGTADLVGLADRFETLAPIVGRALHRSGRDAEAVVVLQNHLLGYPAADPAYAVLLEISGAALAPWLDALYARDRFEERPLIWKASLLLRQGKLPEAEAAVRQALKVDPTDGEMKEGDRVRGYAVLAEILKALGKAEDAAFFERVVASVRVAERGDALTKAGLVRRSLASYEEAANAFADAYCVQWRLAERLSAMGNVAEARKHYQIAFERMPEQFGQVASFCFGCEGVFNHPESRSVAEQVLARLAEAEPRKPQVQYLLGQLREAQGRKAEGYRHYRAAADLDPEYLDAWEKAHSLSAAVFLPQREIDDIGLRMVRLDPLGRHASVARPLWDPAGLWAVYEDAAKLNMPVADRLLPLKASAESLDLLKKRFGRQAPDFERRDEQYAVRRTIPDPGRAVADDSFIQGIVQFALIGVMSAE